MPDRILVFEDDEPTRYAYERALSRAGYRTQGYSSYFEAAEDIDKGAGALLVVDLKLPPHTPNGLAIARMARQHRPGLPIIFVTGYHELANNWLWVFQGGRIWQQAAAVLGFQSAPSNRVRSSFLEGQNGWKPGWASDSHAIGVGAV
jgi:CheY-like chemotaxis protein